MNVPNIKAPKGAGGKGPATGKTSAAKKKAAVDAQGIELRVTRDRLLERFTIMQSDLGGAFYEMAIRDHIKLDVLTRKAAELQRLDAELEEAEEKLKAARVDAQEVCENCGAEATPGAAFCSTCGHALEAGKAK
jgi:ribosomal protein L40E